jgi:2-iminobutanoate/2-iminopropanoate deaminase
MEIVHSPQAPPPVGAYSQAVRHDGLLLVSGQLGMDTAGRLADGPAAQAGRALDNLEAILRAAGLGMSDVLKVTVYLADIDDFEEVNRVYSSRFRQPYPARAAVEVSALPKGALVEIEATAAERG